MGAAQGTGARVAHARRAAVARTGVPIRGARDEACRLADALASVRGRAVPSLPEYNDAAISVLGNGQALNLRIIEHAWNFGHRLGQVPEEFPAAPLARDLAALQKRLRLPPKAEAKTLDLDLRESFDRERSHLLRRLRLLGVDWGTPAGAHGRPRHVSRSMDARVEAGVRNRAHRGQPARAHRRAGGGANLVAERCAGEVASLKTLIALLEDALFADLAAAIGALVAGIENRTALASDVHQLLEALPPLVAVQRYGNVRETDVSLVTQILWGLAPRVFVALPPAAVGIDDDAAPDPPSAHGGRRRRAEHARERGKPPRLARGAAAHLAQRCRAPPHRGLRGAPAVRRACHRFRCAGEVLRAVVVARQSARGSRRLGPRDSCPAAVRCSSTTTNYSASSTPGCAPSASRTSCRCCRRCGARLRSSRRRSDARSASA